MLAVGHQRERGVRPAGADEIPPEDEVHEPRPQDDQEAGLEPTDLAAADQAQHDLVDDDDGGEGDEPALEGRREELDLAVTVRVIPVGGTPGEDQAAETEDGGHHVDDGLEGVGQDRGRPREQVGLVLGAQKHDRHRERDHARPHAHA